MKHEYAAFFVARNIVNMNSGGALFLYLLSLTNDHITCVCKGR